MQANTINTTNTISRDEMYKKDAFYYRFRSLIDHGYTIVGCGGVGSWVAYMLAKMGAKRFILFDGDIVELSNLPRTVYRYSDIGHNKAEALADILREIAPDIEVTAIPEYFDPQLHAMISYHTYLIITTDDNKIKIDLANMKGYFYAVNQDGDVAILSNQEYWEVKWNNGNAEKTEYTRNTNIILSAGAAIAFIDWFLRADNKTIATELVTNELANLSSIRINVPADISYIIQRNIIKLGDKHE